MSAEGHVSNGTVPPRASDRKMIFSFFIISKAGGLIFSLDRQPPSKEVEVVCPYPLDMVLEEGDRGVSVKFGQDKSKGIEVGQSITAVNGQSVVNKKLTDGSPIMDFLSKQENFPISLRFAHVKAGINEKLMLLSMFHSIYAITSKLSPTEGSSGVSTMFAESFNLHCKQTITGVKFVVLTDTKQDQVELFLQKVYELYSDFVLKNPFYSIDMPIKSALFQDNLKKLMDGLEH